ncbi:MAG: alanine racemase [Candidatus Methylomirabilales bacterium]
MKGRGTAAIVSLDAIARNLGRVRDRVGEQVEIMAVVKADAYGHGAVPVARTLVEAGAEWLGVALPEEGVQLRRQGLQVPILVMGPTPPDQTPVLVEHRLDQMVSHRLHARALSTGVGGAGARVRVHLKIDTGMGRLGIHPSEAADAAQAIVRLPGLEFAGAMTHFAAADAPDKGHALEQLRRFLEAVCDIEAAGVVVPLRHAANSAALLDLPETHLDMVRPGIALYGYPPSPSISDEGLWEPGLTFKTSIAQIKQMPKGTTVSYGCTYEAPRDILVATLPVGYADGYNRLLSNRGEVLLRGERAPVIGQVCMDMIMVDVTDVGGVREGEEAVLLGCQGDETLFADEWAARLGTIPYEVLCNISKRVPRSYVRHGKLIDA